MTFKLPEYLKKAFDKYKYLLLICFVGLLFVLFSNTGGKTDPNAASADPQAANAPEVQEIERQLEDILSSIAGVGKTKVMLTYKSGYESIYAYDETQSSAQAQSSLVIISSGNMQQPVVKKTNFPEFLGAVIVCEGADNARLRLDLTNAIRSLTGITSDNIVITKIKQ